MKIKITKLPSNNKFSYGGSTNKLGGDFTNNVTFINEGGTHEQNPFEGVPFGVDNEGTPNLVEEGEVIWNDYVFSNRLTPTKKMLENIGFPDKYKDYSFALIAEELQKESAERPNDLISQRGLQDSMQRLIGLQEEVRNKRQEVQEKKAQAAAEQMYANGGNVNILDGDNTEQTTTGYSYADLAGDLGVDESYLRSNPHEFIPMLEDLGYDYSQLGLSYIPMYDVQPYIEAKKALEDLSSKLKVSTEKFLANPKNYAQTAKKYKLDASKIAANYKKYLELNEENKKAISGVSNIVKEASENVDPDIQVDDDIDIDPILKVADEAYNKNLINKRGKITLNKAAKAYEKALDDSPEFDWGAFGNGMMRMAPLVANATDLIRNLKKPDYTEGDRVLQAAINAPISDIKPEVEDVNIRPIDRNYLLNQQLNQGNTLLSNIGNQAINAQQAMANMMLANTQTQGAIGDSLIKMDEANLARQMQENEFNRGNQQLLTQSRFQNFANNAARHQGIIDATKYSSAYNTQMDATRSQGISGAMGNMATSLAGIGSENIWKNAIDKNPSLLYTFTDGYKKSFADAAAASTAGSKYGGKLLTKKRRK
jgi:hypothetical protein